MSGLVIAIFLVGGFPAAYWLLEREDGYPLPRRILNALAAMIGAPAILMLLSLLLYLGIGALAGALGGIIRGWEMWKDQAAALLHP